MIVVHTFLGVMDAGEVKQRRRIGGESPSTFGQMFRQYSICTDAEFRLGFASVIKQANDGF